LVAAFFATFTDLLGVLPAIWRDQYNHFQYSRRRPSGELLGG